MRQICAHSSRNRLLSVGVSCAKVMIQSYQINFQKSIELQRKYPTYSMPKCCYENVYRLIMNTREFQRQGFGLHEKFIAFGYVKKPDLPLAYRHAFLIEGNQVLDTTLAERDCIYYVAERFCFTEYLHRIIKSAYYDLHNDQELKQKEQVLYKALLEEEIYCCG